MVVVVMIRCRKLAGRSDASNGRAAIASTQNKLRGKITRYELLIAISTVVRMWLSARVVAMVVGFGGGKAPRFVVSSELFT